MSHPKSPETRLKIARALSGNVPWNKGVKMSQEHIESNRAGQLGKRLSPEHIESIARAGMGKKHTLSWNQNIAAGLVGRHDAAVEEVIADVGAIWSRIGSGETRYQVSLDYDVSYSHFCRIVKRYRSGP